MGRRLSRRAVPGVRPDATPAQQSWAWSRSRPVRKWLAKRLRNFQAIQRSLEARRWDSRDGLETRCSDQRCLRRVGDAHADGCLDAGQLVTDPRPARIEAWWRAEGARWMDANPAMLDASRATLFAAVNRRVDALFLGSDVVAWSLAANEAYSGAWARRLETLGVKRTPPPPPPQAATGDRYPALRDPAHRAELLRRNAARGDVRVKVDALREWDAYLDRGAP